MGWLSSAGLLPIQSLYPPSRGPGACILTSLPVLGCLHFSCKPVSWPGSPLLHCYPPREAHRRRARGSGGARAPGDRGSLTSSVGIISFVKGPKLGARGSRAGAARHVGRPGAHVRVAWLVRPLRVGQLCWGPLRPLCLLPLLSTAPCISPTEDFPDSSLSLRVCFSTNLTRDSHSLQVALVPNGRCDLISQRSLFASVLRPFCWLCSLLPDWFCPQIVTRQAPPRPSGPSSNLTSSTRSFLP